MDGTLVDTEPYWIEAEFALAERHGGRWSREHALRLVGNDLLVLGRYVRDHMGIELTPQQIVEELLDGVVTRVSRRIPWRPGARELLGALRAAGVACGLVTMSYERFVAPVVAALPAGTFGAVVTGDAVAAGKPDPEAYLTAARLLGVEPRDCVAIEDSEPGAVSAEAAGCAVLVVPLHVVVPPGPGRVLLDSLTGLTPASLRRLARTSGGPPTR